MKKIPWLLKAIIAGTAAFIVLNFFSFLYYNVPARQEVPDGATDYKWPANAFHAMATEGFGYGNVNDDGYNNPEDLKDIDEINVLFMGSSHLEGFNLSPDRNAAAVLQKLTGKTVYNIGISEHTLLRCLDNLENALNKYDPTEYVIIETMTVSFYDEELQNALNGEGRLPTYSGGVMDILQTMKYLKLVYYQYNNLTRRSSPGGTAPLTNEGMLDQLLSSAEKTCEDHNVRLMIVFHPTLTVDDEGKITANFNTEDAELMEKVCTEKGIVFINMADSFIEHYLKESELPHGFSNTVPGSGHLNETGHYLIAQKVNEAMEANRQ